MKPPIPEEILDELLKNYSQPEDLLGPGGLLTELKKRLINRVLESELTTHLGYEKHGSPVAGPPNARNGHSAKTLRSDDGKLPVKIPRDRNGGFEPTLVPKHQRHFDGFDDCIISLYSRGLGVREIQQHLLEIYKVEVSTALITNATEAVAEEVKTWQNRTLDAVYPIVYFDAIVAKVRHEGKVANRAIYLALAINLEGNKEVLGMWSSENEGARFWLGVATELKNRGLQDILICCVDGLGGFGPALEAVYPKCRVQRCIVHQLRNSLKFVNWKERKAVAASLRGIYTAPTASAAAAALAAFRATHDARYPAIGKSWETHWHELTPFFDYPPEIRKIIYTTNAIESLNSSLRKISRHRNLFPTIDSLYKLFYLSLKNISARWTRPLGNWAAALNRFSIEFGDRMPNNP
ncbi:MAG: IS256 family transposase [Verrucomicrobiaceae bacterium]|nr:MAG: IS256 family transposase [Verrucomicrobiaceae bacterium]